LSKKLSKSFQQKLTKGHILSPDGEKEMEEEEE
jgi:hypothetical protein